MLRFVSPAQPPNKRNMMRNIVWRIKDLKYKLRWIKWFWQRGKRGYSDYDNWGVYDYLLKIIPPMLEYLKDGSGYPCEFESIEGWIAKIDEILVGFEAAKRIESLDYNLNGKQLIKALDNDHKIFKKGMKEFTEYFFALWD